MLRSSYGHTGRSPAPEQREDRGENGCRKAPSERPAQRWPDGYANVTDSRAPARLWRSSDALMCSFLPCAGRIAAPPGRSLRHDRTKAGTSSDAVRKGLPIADEALEEPGGSPSGEEGPLSGGLARDPFLKELRARIGEKWGLLPDGDAAGFPLLFFVRRTVRPCSRSIFSVNRGAFHTVRPVVSLKKRFFSAQFGPGGAVSPPRVPPFFKGKTL